MFFIVRHGNTFDAVTPPRRIGARTDLPLTEAGVEQGSALGRYFAQRGIQFARAFVSPLLRTRQTASAILEHQFDAPQIEEAPFLKEIDHGPDENQTEDEVLQRIGNEALSAWDLKAEVPNGWIVEPEKRIKAWRALFAQGHDTSPILLVTSNGAARFALLADGGLRKQAQMLESLKLPTGGFGIIGRDANGALSLREWGLRP
ncbi:hypothetical protein NAP1_15463 [Erythrobacter sp. NAP1]|uniref:histidine phosphatase family protein n=1 Tax=Erythrobacter sp. NAP1 TaxID=237727 RepID=UPI0000687643|nr:histidine phosphatase family protein [Erythrobacter sp. NAP1]EAQ29010.1 hypothetical protein NAP1_15463 [Erythrobacter sp. NAP1]